MGGGRGDYVCLMLHRHCQNDFHRDASFIASFENPKTVSINHNLWRD